MKSRRSLAIAMRLSPVLLIGVVPAVAAQTAAADGELEELVAARTRAAARSVTESPVPIDVLSGEDFENQAGTDLSNLLRTVVPSYNVNSQPISDAATIVRPANLRGLAPAPTLVLVHGKRRPRARGLH